MVAQSKSLPAGRGQDKSERNVQGVRALIEEGTLVGNRQLCLCGMNDYVLFNGDRLSICGGDDSYGDAKVEDLSPMRG